MQIPETVIYSEALPEAECLALFPGAVIGSVADPAEKFLKEAGAELSVGASVKEMPGPSAAPARHLLFAAAKPLSAQDKESVELFKARLTGAITLADGLGVKEFCLLSLPAEAYDSRLFAFNTVLFRVLMGEREKHPALERIRFFCPTQEDAQWLARVYNFYYPSDKSERMAMPGEED